MTVDDVSMDNKDGSRRRARRTAVIFGLLALAFYIGVFCLVHWRHMLS